MRAGKLDRKITLQRVSEEVGPSGTVAERWIDFASPWAELVQSVVTEQASAPGETEIVKLGFRIRYLPGITTADRVAYDGEGFGIVELREVGRRQGLELVCVRTQT